jgi:hypothetical protein
MTPTFAHRVLEWFMGSVAMVFDDAALGARWPQPGDVFLQHEGGLYRVTALCTVEATLAPGVLYQALDPQACQDQRMRPLSEFLARDARPGRARFALLRRPGLAALRGYIPQDVLCDAQLEAVLSRCAAGGGAVAL